MRIDKDCGHTGGVELLRVVIGPKELGRWGRLARLISFVYQPVIAEHVEAAETLVATSYGH